MPEVFDVIAKLSGSDYHRQLSGLVGGERLKASGLAPYERIWGQQASRDSADFQFSFNYLSTCDKSSLIEGQDKLSQCLYELALPKMAKDARQGNSIYTMNTLSAIFHTGKLGLVSEHLYHTPTEPQSTVFIWDNSGVKKPFVLMREAFPYFNLRKESDLSLELLALRFLEHCLFQTLRRINNEWYKILETSFSQVAFLVCSISLAALSSSTNYPCSGRRSLWIY